MRNKNKEIGKLGEEIAAKYLKKKGYKIIERNWGNKWGEIDIIATSGRRPEVYVFVEVKTKIGTQFGLPEDMVNHKKLAQIQRMASTYDPAKDAPKQIDVVAIVLRDRTSKTERIEHYEAVY